MQSENFREYSLNKVSSFQRRPSLNDNMFLQRKTLVAHRNLKISLEEIFKSKKNSSMLDQLNSNREEKILYSFSTYII